jgi:hypothetical protein
MQPKRRGIDMAEELPAVTAARREYASDELRIDDKPAVSPCDDGAWVAAWVWVWDDNCVAVPAYNGEPCGGACACHDLAINGGTKE